MSSNVNLPTQMMRIEEPFLIDTSTLIALNNRSHSKSEKIQSIFSIEENRNNGLLAPQVLYEYYVVLTRSIESNGFGRSPKEVIDNITIFIQNFNLLFDPPRILSEWTFLALEKTLTGKISHDARLVAWMRCYGISKILTLNQRDFVRLGVEVVEI